VALKVPLSGDGSTWFRISASRARSLARYASELQEYPIALSQRVRLAYHFVHRDEVGGVRSPQVFSFTRRQIAHVLKNRL
jgi:hypothetical protein